MTYISCWKFYWSLLLGRELIGQFFTWYDITTFDVSKWAIPTMLQRHWKGHMSHFPQTSPPTRPGYGHSSLPRSSRNGRNACFRRWKRSAATGTAGRNACGRSCGVWSRTGTVVMVAFFFLQRCCFSFKENSSTHLQKPKTKPCPCIFNTVNTATTKKHRPIWNRLKMAGCRRSQLQCSYWEPS